MFTLSARGKRARTPLPSFLARHYPDVPLAQVDSVFGFAGPCSLYGGRPYFGRELSDRDIETLYELGIGLRLPLTNHYVDDEEYDRCADFLQRYHRPGNSAIVVCDRLAERLRADFPAYRLEASVIKNVDDERKLARALERYDTVVLPMERNDDLDFLARIGPKDRLRLFANAGCAYNCPAHSCYRNISRLNKSFCSGNPLLALGALVRFPFTIGCSRAKIERAKLGVKDFDVPRLQALGFTRFKMLRGHAIRKSCR